jgi:polyisoprenoid-binding protein YceI
MKNLKTIAIALLVAFGTTVATAQNKKINVEKSKINWVGKKLTGEHSGTINFKEGTLVFQKNKLKGGSFTVDMNSINTTDLTGDYKKNLDGHLKADDFFGVEKHPTAKLDFKLISDNGDGTYNVTADLTIKGITKPITFVIAVKGNSAVAKLNVDRTKYDIKYKSKNFFENLGDNVINDEFELTVNLQF